VLWDAFGWLVHLIEASAVILVILGIGAVIAVSAFWLLARAVGMLAGTSVDTEQPEDETSMTEENDSEWTEPKFRGGV